MHVHIPAIPKSLFDTEIGELIKVPVRGQPVFALVSRKDGNDVHLLVLEPTSEVAPYPVFMINGANPKCLSFGLDWVLEPVLGPESYPGNSDFNAAPGTFFIRPEGSALLMYPTPGNIQYTEITIDPSTMEFVQDVGRYATPCATWNVWESLKSFEDPHSVPLHTVRAVKE